MKRGIAGALCALMLVLATVTASAAAREIALPGADAAARVPDGWHVMTRAGALNAGDLAAFGMEEDEALRFMEENAFYLYLYHEDLGAEIYLTLLDSGYARGLGALDALSEAELAEVRDEVAVGLDGWAVEGPVTQARHGDLLYLVADMRSDEPDPLYNRQLFTVWEGQEVYIDLYALDGPVTPEMAARQDEVADGLRLGAGAAPETQPAAPDRALLLWKLMTLGALLTVSVGLCMAVFMAVSPQDD